MVSEPNESVNAVIAKALEDAGVPARNIEVPPGTEVKPGEGTPSLDGLPKGQVKGESPEEKATREAAESSEAGAVKPPEAVKPGEPTEPVLDKTGIEALITDASSKFQSIMDKKINTLTFQMQQTIGALNQFFQTQESASIAGLPAEEQVQKRLEILEKGGLPKIQIQAQQPIEQQPVQFYQQLVNFVDTVGLKIDDKRIDWSPEPGITPEVGFSRFLVSIKAALLADQTKVIKELKEGGAKVITNLRKKTGVDKVSVTPPSGAGIPDVDKMTPMQKIEYGFQQQEELSQISQ